MKIFFKYLGLDLKRSTIRSVVFTLISTFYIMIMMPQNITPFKDQGKLTYKYCSTGMEDIAIVLMVLSTIMPFLCLLDFKNRRNTDTLFSLPISRFNLSLVYFTSGFIQILFIYTVTFFTSYFYLLANTDIFDLSYMLLYFPLSILGALLIYCFFAFFFSVTNNIIDGVLISGLWVLLIIWGFDYFDHSKVDRFISNIFIMNWSSIYSPLKNLTVVYSENAEVLRIFTSTYKVILDTEYMYFIWAIVGLLCGIGFFFYSSKKKANKIGENSDSIFAYKGAIPLFGTIFALDFHDPSIFYIAIYTFIMYVIYRRSFKFKKWDYVIWALTLVIGFVLSKIR